MNRAHQAKPRGRGASDDRRTWQGFGDGFTQAFEMAVVPALFAFGGLALDRWLGIVPVLTITLAVFGMAGTFARAYYTYNARMAQDERERPTWGTPR